MPKTRPPYSPEFRRQMVDLVRAGRDPADLAREFEPTAQSICHWVTQADRQEGRREEKSDGLASAERDELARLRRENKQLRLGPATRLRESATYDGVTRRAAASWPLTPWCAETTDNPKASVKVQAPTEALVDCGQGGPISNWSSRQFRRQ
jgi:transposase